MTDWREAGLKADAHRIRDLYRNAFGSESKDAARALVIAALRKAGGATVLDLWGGGLSANALIAADFNVVSVDNGSLALTDRGHTVSAARKHRALKMTANEDGYQARWGKVAEFAAEADCAFLDFCGPWSGDVRRAVEACRHMKAVIVTLLPSHDAITGATTVAERRVIFEALLKYAANGLTQKGQPARRGAFPVTRLLCTYRQPGRPPVWVFILTKARLSLKRDGGTRSIRYALDPDFAAIDRKRAADRERQRRVNDPVWRARKNARQTEIRAASRNDPDAMARYNAYHAAYRARKRNEAHAGTAASDKIPSSIAPI